MKRKEDIEELLKIAVAADLGGVDFLSQFSYAQLADGYNGIGPEFLPADIRKKVSDQLDLFAPAALIHDLRYAAGDGSRYGFNYANFEFRENCFKLAQGAYPWWNWRRYRALLAAEALFGAVASDAGWIAYCEASNQNKEEQ